MAEDNQIYPAEFARRMKKIKAAGDIEGGHSDADKLLCETLRSLGYGEGVDMFEAMSKWYA